LLSRLRHSPSDQAAWDEFVERYSPRIYGWCRRWNLQEADAQDVTQDVLLRLAEKMRTFAYDPSGSFRGWLKTLAHHAWHDFVKKRERAGAGSGDWMDTPPHTPGRFQTSTACRSGIPENQTVRAVRGRFASWSR
jgi:RNA polymerase sigma-70 factor (ECF subfamily)